MGKEKASAALFDQLQTAIEGGEGEEIVGKVKVSIAGTRSSAHNTRFLGRHKPSMGLSHLILKFSQ